MPDFRSVAQLLGQQQSSNGLLGQVVAKLFGQTRLSSLSLTTTTSPQPAELHQLVREDIRKSQSGWREIADAIELVTAFEPEHAIDWLIDLRQLCFPMTVETTGGSLHARQHTVVFGCFLGILKSIEWFDQGEAETMLDPENIKEIFSPFLLEESGFQIDYSDVAFGLKKDGDTYRQEVSQIIDHIADARHFGRFQALIQEMSTIREETLSNSYFQDSFLKEVCYSTFGTLKSSADQATVLLSVADFIRVRAK